MRSGLLQSELPGEADQDPLDAVPGSRPAPPPPAPVSCPLADQPLLDAAAEERLTPRRLVKLKARGGARRVRVAGMRASRVEAPKDIA
jgi:hypothetical protein